MATNRWVNSSTTDSCTRKRLAAVQASPMLRSLAANAPSTALSRSASSNTIRGALPPSSMEVRRTLSAASFMSFTPTGVEPVKDTLRRRGSCMMGPEIAEAEEPDTTLSTPLGRPASCMTCAKSCVVSGVSLAALSTMVQPAATAGPTLRVAMARGKFQGVISRQGPTGLWCTCMRRAPSGMIRVRP